MQFIKKIKLDEATFTEYNLIVFRKKNRITWSVIGVAVALVYIYLNGASNFLLALWAGIGLGVLFILLSYFLSRVNINRNAKLMYEKQNIANLDMVFTVNDYGIIQGNTRDKFNFAWKTLKSCKETDLAFYFFYARLNALAVAKAPLSEGEVKTIQDLIKQNFTNKRK